jgi:hypothetical protein
MTLATGILLIALPIAFNLAFAALAVGFGYPDILRKPTSEVLARFRAGGPRLLMLWWAFAFSAIVFAPVAVLLSGELRGADAALLQVTTVTGVLAALVQFLGLVRWPFLVPYLAREAEHASPARAEAIEIVFQSFNRYLGVAVGEHLGYLFTGAWSALVGAAILQAAALPWWLGVAGIVIGVVLAACSLEFVGPFERAGWKLAGAVTPVAYIAWSAWLVVVGVFVLL